ncbi:MAG: nickel-dependent lactate racemase [Spirochaetes bacterium]|jgi:nickel-dependent lactate racemase|nr:nickel-dependent lactate racemase [Spirochaetota bacterium]
MEINLPWGKEKLSLNVPDTWTLHFPKRESTLYFTEKNKTQENDTVRESLSRPVKSLPISRYNLKSRRILIVIDDNTRPTPVHRFMKLVLDELRRGGADYKNITVIPALGIHTRMTKDQMARKIGEKNYEKVRCVNHDPNDVVKLQYIGITSRGTRIVVNRRVPESDFIVCIGLIEPHLWAGFGGGMKNIFPGLGSSESIGKHHSIISEPPYSFNRVGMSPEKNSFRLDLEETRGMIEAPIFCVNVVLNLYGQVIGAFSGDPVAAHRTGVAFCNKISGLKLQQRVDAVIVNSSPMDINFKQSMKGVGNSLPALRPGGTIMGFLRAERGLDDIRPPEDSKPLWLVRGILRALGPSRVMTFLNLVKRGLNVEDKFLIYYSMQLIREYDLYFYVPTVSDEEARRLGFFHSFGDPQSVINEAARKLPPDASVAVFTEAGATYPLIPGA